MSLFALFDILSAPRVRKWRIRTEASGNLSLLTALLVTPSAIAIVIAIEMVSVSQERTLMQAAADAAALAGARDLMVAGSSQRSATSFA